MSFKCFVKLIALLSELCSSFFCTLHPYCHHCVFTYTVKMPVLHLSIVTQGIDADKLRGEPHSGTQSRELLLKSQCGSKLTDPPHRCIQFLMQGMPACLFSLEYPGQSTVLRGRLVVERRSAKMGISHSDPLRTHRPLRPIQSP